MIVKNKHPTNQQDAMKTDCDSIWLRDIEHKDTDHLYISIKRVYNYFSFSFIRVNLLRSHS